MLEITLEVTKTSDSLEKEDRKQKTRNYVSVSLGKKDFSFALIFLQMSASIYKDNCC